MVPPQLTPESKLRVLVIDHEKNIRATLSLCLEQGGCEVTAVSSRESALDALSRQPFDPRQHCFRENQARQRPFPVESAEHERNFMVPHAPVMPSR